MTRLPKPRLHNVVGMPFYEKMSARNRYDFLITIWDMRFRIGVFLSHTYYPKEAYL